jgi:hypothetical protein
MMTLALRSIFVHTSKGYLTCHKIVWHKTDGFTALLRKVCCGFLSPSPGLNPWTSGTMARTLTITPPRTIVLDLLFLNYLSHFKRKGGFWNHFFLGNDKKNLFQKTGGSRCQDIKFCLYWTHINNIKYPHFFTANSNKIFNRNPQIRQTKNTCWNNIL